MSGHVPLSLAPEGTVLFPIYAHQGGWDEVLLVAVPLMAIGILLWIANRRVNNQLEEAAQEEANRIDDGQSTPKTP